MIFVDRRKKWSIDRKKTVASERSNPRSLYHSVEGIIQKIDK